MNIQPFTVVSGVAPYLSRANIDTDAVSYTHLTLPTN